ncbi:uncharacterized protein L969DRAFT_45762, partial [Mixia osmundae IAM 14324]
NPPANGRVVNVEAQVESSHLCPQAHSVAVSYIRLITRLVALLRPRTLAGRMSRQSIAPGPSSTQSLKARQISLLSTRLQELTLRIDAFEQLVATCSQQAVSIRDLGVSHAAWFMSAAKVLAPVVDEPPHIHMSEEAGLRS